MWLSPGDCQDGMRKAVMEPLPENPLTVNLLSENEGDTSRSRRRCARSITALRGDSGDVLNA